MCDYSLESVASRPARVGDKLISTRFPASTTRGFAGVDDPTVAVCLQPGTELAFESPVECGSRFNNFSIKVVEQTVARFRHINEKEPHAHHDALEFGNGETVLVTQLCENQYATVLQLPAQDDVESQRVEAVETVEA